MTAVGSDLRRLAEAMGVMTTFTDAFGTRRTASVDALVAVLRILGAELDEPSGAGGALRAWEADRARSALEPVVVAWDGRLGPFPIRLPVDDPDLPVSILLEADDGSWTSPPAPLMVSRSADRPGRAGVVDAVAIPPETVGQIPFGYHRFTVRLGGVEHHATLLSAPPRCVPFPGPAWGTFLPLYALRRPGDRGVGDVGDLRRMMEWTESLGGRTVGTLPLYASFLGPRGPFSTSPYSPVSTRFWNELFADVTAAPEHAMEPGSPMDPRPPAERDPSGPPVGDPTDPQFVNLIDYRQAMGRTRAILEPMAHAAHQDPSRRAWLERAVAQRPELDDYARFRAAIERTGTSWRAWPEPARGGLLRESDAIVDAAAARYHRYVQALMADQMAALPRDPARGVGLLLDLPVGAHPDGYDVWRDRETFAVGANAGAPPDTFFALGQDWGFPPPHREHLRRTGYASVRSRLRTAMRHAAAIRLDHILGFHRLYWIPAGAPPSEGVYVRYPSDELFAVLCIESDAAGTPVVGEDLGTVPKAIHRAMDRHGVLRTYVLELELWPGREPALPAPPRASLATLNTHDLPTFAAYVGGTDVDDRARMGLLDAHEAEEAAAERGLLLDRLRAMLTDRGLLGPRETRDPRALLRASLELLATSDAELVLVNLEDLWGESLRQNLPGTSTEEPNWRRRARLTFDESIQSPEVVGALEAVDRRRRESARGRGRRRGGPEQVGRAGRAGRAGQADRDGRDGRDGRDATDRQAPVAARRGPQ